MQTHGPVDLAGQPTKWQVIKRRLIAAAIAVVVYTLSFGPMFWTWFSSKFIGGSPFWAAVYEPLYLAANFVPPYGWLVARYVDLWVA